MVEVGHTLEIAILSRVYCRCHLPTVQLYYGNNVLLYGKRVTLVTLSRK